MKPFNSEEIKDALRALDIDFECNGVYLENLNFKSFRKIEAQGIYFAEGLIPPDIQDSLILCKSLDHEDSSNGLIQCEHPQVAFYKLMRHFFEGASEHPKIHPTAVIDPEALIDPLSEVGPFCVIGKATLAAGVKLNSHVVIHDCSFLGANTQVESHSTIGATGVAWVWNSTSNQRIVQPQIGGVIIEANCFIGSDVSIVRGSVNENTVIGSGTVIAHGTKIGHGCVVGKECHCANNVTLAGNITAGDRCFFGAASVVRPLVVLPANTTVGAGAVVIDSYTEQHLVLVGNPAKPRKQTKTKLNGVPTPQATQRPLGESS